MMLLFGEDFHFLPEIDKLTSLEDRGATFTFQGPEAADAFPVG